MSTLWSPYARTSEPSAAEELEHERSLGSWRYKLFQPNGLNAFEQTLLDALNAARANVVPPASPALPPFAWSQALALDAQEWVDGCEYGINPDNSVLGFGQNIFFNSFPASERENAALAVQDWVEAGEFYDYNTNTCSDPNNLCGFYTQVVWRDSTEVGCAVAACSNASFSFQFVSCNFFPAGNVIFQRPY
ncbi:MAG: CAP domain-containing protein [Pseudomonadota bacterium]